MGNRFIWTRYLRGGYSNRRVMQRLNESDFEPHRMRPYGLGSRGFKYRQMFEEAQSNRSRRMNRSAKKAARREARKRLLPEE